MSIRVNHAAGLGIDRAALDKEFFGKIQPILKSACLECHFGWEAEAGLALGHFKSSKSILEEPQTWEKVIQRLELEDMPPKDAAPLAGDLRSRKFQGIGGILRLFANSLHNDFRLQLI